MSGDPVSIFISYVKADETYLRELVSHLDPLQRNGLISSWYDGQLLPGEEMKPLIKANLERAEMILLLISKDFLNSDYSYEVELTQAIARHQAGTACVVPIILRPCLWNQVAIGGLRLSELQVLPQQAKPVSQWNSHDEAFTHVVEELLRKFEQLTAAQSQPTSRPSNPGAANPPPMSPQEAASVLPKFSPLKPDPSTVSRSQPVNWAKWQAIWAAVVAVGVALLVGLPALRDDQSPTTQPKPQPPPARQSDSQP
ncbi:MAG: toll/interleukin-1 receptor domain-containing protein [Cyanobacteria bacterium J06638_6]